MAEKIKHMQDPVDEDSPFLLLGSENSKMDKFAHAIASKHNKRTIALNATTFQELLPKMNSGTPIFVGEEAVLEDYHDKLRTVIKEKDIPIIYHGNDVLKFSSNSPVAPIPPNELVKNYFGGSSGVYYSVKNERIKEICSVDFRWRQKMMTKTMRLI